MKLKTAIAVLVIGLCPAASWAAEQGSEQHSQAAVQDSTVTGASGESAQDNGKTIGWQYVNGRTTDAERGGMQGAQSAESSGSPNVATAATADNDSGDSQDQLATTEAAQESAQDQVMGDQSIRLQGIPEGLEDKLVVILPADWQGSLSDLLAALEETSQDSEILVLRRDTQEDVSPQDSSDMEDTSGTDAR